MAAAFKSLTAGCALLTTNRNLAKVTLAGGLQQAAANVANTFVLAGLRARIWEHQQAEYMAIASIWLSIVAMLSAGPFGRFSDNVDRRIAVAVFGFGSFVPSWSLLVFGMNSTGLWVNTACMILGSYGLTSNVMVALLNDVTTFEERDLATGAYFAGTSVLLLFLTGIPTLFIVVLDLFATSPKLVLLYQVFLSLAFFVSLRWISIDKTDGNPNMTLTPNPNMTMVDADVEAATPGVNTSSEKCAARSSKFDYVKGIVTELYFLLCVHRRLRRLCLSSLLLSFGGDLIMDISGQFFNEALELLPYGSQTQLTTVSVLCMLPGMLMMIPGYLVTAHLSERSGALKLLRRLSFATCFLVMPGMIMLFIPKYWLLPIVVTAGNWATLWHVPMLRLVAGVAPPGRTGEALGAMGMASQAASLLGNLVVAGLNPHLMVLGWSNPLWVYFPICGFVTLCGVLPLIRTPKGGWGASAGRVEDVVAATTMAHVAAQRWKKFVADKKMAATSSIESAGSTSSAVATSASTVSTADPQDTVCEPSEGV